MTKAVTAIYRTHEAADLVRKDLAEAGIGARDVKVVPSAPLGDADRADASRWNDGLHALNVPEDDMRTYQGAVRGGDVVVSVELDGDEDLARVQEIMRHPEREAYDQTALDAAHAGSAYTPREGTDGWAADDRYLGARDPMDAGGDGRTRAYTRPTRQSYDDPMMGSRHEGTLKSA